MPVQLITRPRCGHPTMVRDCVHCLAHHLDLIRHAEALLRQHRASRPQVNVSVLGLPVAAKGAKKR